MRGPRALDEEIRRCEEEIALHRQGMHRALEASDERFRDAVATPKVLLAAAAAGFAVDRLTGGLGKPRRKPVRNGAANGTAEVAQRAGMTALLGTAATALLRQQLMTPGSTTRRYLMQMMGRPTGADRKKN